MYCYKSKGFYIAALLSLPFFSPLASAAYQSPMDTWVNSPTNLVASLSLGPVWEDAGQTQTFRLTPRVIKTFTGRDTTHTLADGEFFIGLQRALTDQFQGQLGLEFAATSNATVSGNIWDDANPIFNNFTYKYSIQHSHIAVAGKVLMNRCEGYLQCYGFIPWIGGSLGVGFNNAHAFKNTPIIFEALPTPNFGSNTQTSFTYTLKVGVQKPLSCHWQIGANYEFADWGRSQLNRAPRQTLNSGLNLSHVYTNGILFNMTYFA